MSELVDRIQDRMNAMKEDAEGFANRVGWDVETALGAPDNAWDDWNLDMLQAICNDVGLCWRHALPLSVES